MKDILPPAGGKGRGSVGTVGRTGGKDIGAIAKGFLAGAALLGFAAYVPLRFLASS
jgi:hypothetical protein